MNIGEVRQFNAKQAAKKMAASWPWVGVEAACGILDCIAEEIAEAAK